MLENYAQFTPIASTLGGIIIGIASVLMMMLFGRIAGVSGILGSALSFPKNDTLWRIAFILGIMSSGIVFSGYIDFELLRSPIQLKSLPIVVLAGLLVGFGTRLGSGCTSGHGICGVSRFSIRSLIATALFVLSGMATVFFMKIIA